MVSDVPKNQVVMSISIIYKITSPSNKVYIGQTRNWSERKSNYRTLNCKAQPILYNSLLKYGFSAHKIEIIFKLAEGSTQDEIDRQERFYWEFYRNKGIELLNCREPGVKGHYPEKIKKKISLGLKGRKLSKEHKQKIAEINRSPERRLALYLANFGRVLSKDKREQISNSLKKAWANGEYKDRKIRSSNKLQNPIRTIEFYNSEDILVKSYFSYKECGIDNNVSPLTVLSYINKKRLFRGHIIKYGQFHR